MSYAGVPFIIGLPSLYLSIKSVITVYKTHRHLQRSRSDSVDVFSQFARTTHSHDTNLRTSTTQVRFDPHLREQIVPTISNRALSSRQFHLPFKSCHLSAQEIGTDDRDSSISESFPTFAKPNLIGKDDQPDGWQAEANGKVGAARPPSPFLAESPQAQIDSSNKEWIVDKDAELDCGYSREDFAISDGPNSGNYICFCTGIT